MAKTKKKKHYGGWILLLCMVLYAMIFLAAAGYGLEYVWDIMETYEASRTHVPIDAYMAQLDGDYIFDRSDALLAKIDPAIQSPEDCRQVIRDFVKGGITYAKKSSECTDTHQVYVLRSGGKVIGEFAIDAVGEEKYGLIPWQVTGDSFDLSFLLTGTVSVTAPHNYPVSVNGYPLTEKHVTKTNIQYKALSDFYKDYSLPYMVSYQAGPRLGAIDLQVTDPAGNPVVIGENTDLTPLLDLKTQPQRQEIEAFMGDFVLHYMYFMGNQGDRLNTNYRNLLKYVKPGSSLESRISQSRTGLIWIAYDTVTMDKMEINLCVPIGGDRYIVDVTYAATLTHHKHPTKQPQDNAKLVVVKTSKGWQVETMLSY